MWKFFGLGFLGVQVLAGNACREGWGAGHPASAHGAEITAGPGLTPLEQDASSGNGNAAPLRCIPQPAPCWEHSNPPV